MRAAGAVRLAETIEQVGQELGGDASPSSRTQSRTASSTAVEIVTVPPAGVNFSALMSRFEAICCSRRHAHDHVSSRRRPEKECERHLRATAAGRATRRPGGDLAQVDP